jgi:hypothetical protein
VAHWDPVKKDGWNTEDFSIVEGDTLRQTYWVRPYPARIAGAPGSFAVAQQPAASVELAWTHEPALGATRLFAPFQPLFGAQAFVETASDVSCAYEPDRRHLRCTSGTAGDKRIILRECAQGEACVTISEPEPELDAGAGDGHGDGDRDAGVETDDDAASAADGSVGPAPTVMPNDSGCALATGRAPRWGWLLLLAGTWLLVRRSRYNSAHE